MHYPDPPALSRQTWQVIVQFFHLDLSETDAILPSAYSKFGPAPRMPSCMLRSYLLSIKLKFTSITEWVCELKSSPLYAILSGFTPGGVPGVGTFYDFFNRIRLSDSRISLTGDSTPVQFLNGYNSIMWNLFIKRNITSFFGVVCN